MSLTLETRLQRNPQLVGTQLDREQVMLNIETGSYYGLAGTAGRIWDLFEQPRSLGEVVAVLLKEYAVDEATCQASVLRFAGELQREGLLQPVAA